MKLAWDRWCTSDHGSHEYEFWRDAVCDGVVESDLDLSVDGRAGFSGTMYGQSRGDSRLVNFESARHRIRRSSAQARRHGHDRLMLSLQCKGRAVLVQNGAEEAIGPGDLGLLNAGSAFDIDFPEQTAGASCCCRAASSALARPCSRGSTGRPPYAVPRPCRPCWPKRCAS